MSAPSPPLPTTLPIQWAPLTDSDLKSPAALNNRLTQLFNAVSAVQGAAGPTQLHSGVDVGGRTVSNVGEPTSPTDAISKLHAEANYSAAALAPQLEAGTTSGTSLKTYRALNSKNQQENYSTFLNKVANTTPTTNDTVVTASPPSGGNVTITIPAGNHLYMDGTIVPFGTFSVTVPLPSTHTITSVSRTGGVTTASGSFAGLLGGEAVYVAGIADASFDGNFELSTASAGTITWAQPNFANGSSGAGTASTGGCYYFYLKNPSETLDVSGPFPQDSQLNRLESNVDNQTLIAVAVVNSSGLVTTQSAAGATVPVAQNNGNRVLARL